MTILEAAISNAIVVLIPAILALWVARIGRFPALARALWLLVFIKLVTPPIAPLTCWTFEADQRMRIVARPVVEPLLETRPEDLAATVGIAGANWSSWDSGSVQLPRRAPAVESRDARAREPSDVGRQSDANRTSDFVSSRAAIPWAALAISIWVAGIGVHLLRDGVRIWKFWRVVKLARRVRPALQSRVAELAGSMGMRRVPEVRVLANIPAPMVWAPGRPYLLLPDGLLDPSSASARDAMVVHELAHLRSKDHWTRRFELLVSALYWWYPLVWLARQRIREAEEQICDAWVVTTLPGVSKAYATSLIDIVGQLAGHNPKLPPAAIGLSQFRLLKRRITMILQGNASPRLTAAGWTVFLLAASLVVPLTPTTAQSTADAIDPTEELREPLADLVEPMDDLREPSPAVEAVNEPLSDLRVGPVPVLVAQVQRETRLEEPTEVMDNPEAEEAVADRLDELRQAIKDMDDEILEAIDEAREEIEEFIAEAPEDVQRELMRIDVPAIVNGVLEESPRPVREFIREVDPATIVTKVLQRADVEDLEPSDELRDRVRARLDRELMQHVRELSRHVHQQVDDIQRQIQREVRRAPPAIQEVLHDVDFDRELADVVEESSPIVQEIVEKVHIEEMVHAGLARDRRRDRELYADPRPAQSGRIRESQRRDQELYLDRDDRRATGRREIEEERANQSRRRREDRRIEVLERQLHRLLQQADEIVGEIEALKRGSER